MSKVKSTIRNYIERSPMCKKNGRWYRVIMRGAQYLEKDMGNDENKR